MFIGRTDAEAETPILWPVHGKSWLTGKDSNVGRDWGQEEKGTTEDEVAEWHHRLDGCEFEWTPGVDDGHREAWRAAIHGITKSWTWLSDWTELIHLNIKYIQCSPPYLVPNFSQSFLSLCCSNFLKNTVGSSNPWNPHMLKLLIVFRVEGQLGCLSYSYVTHCLLAYLVEVALSTVYWYWLLLWRYLMHDIYFSSLEWLDHWGWLSSDSVFIFKN